MTGTVSPLYEPAMKLKQAGVVPGHDLTTEAALAKLSYLLALPGLTVEDITRQMSESLRGELTEQTRIAFEHPKRHLSTSVAELTALGYAIAQGKLDCLKDNIGRMLNEGDYFGNTPLVSAALLCIMNTNPAFRSDGQTHFSILQPPGLHSRSCGFCS